MTAATSGEMRSGHVSRPLRARENAHRRGVLVSIGALLVFSMSPVFGHHLAAHADAWLAGRDHFLHVCLIALHLLLEPVHTAFHVLLVAGLLYAVVDRVRAVRAARRLVGMVEWTAPVPHGVLWNAARQAGLAAEQVRVASGLPNPAFTVGWFSPRVYVAAELPEVLSAPQLTAVLAHERAHVTRRDPLRLSALRFLACTLFYLPAMRRLADDVADEAEIAADDIALMGANASGPAILASAIVDVAERWGRAASRQGSCVTGAMVGFQRDDLLERRVRRLLGQDAEVGTHVTRRSIVGAGAALAAVWMSGLIMAHPLPPGMEGEVPLFSVGGSHAVMHSPAHQTHCDHHGDLALSHLFCLGWHTHEAGSPCPHMAVVRSPVAATG